MAQLSLHVNSQNPRDEYRPQARTRSRTNKRTFSELVSEVRGFGGATDPGARPGTSSRPARPPPPVSVSRPRCPHFKDGFLLDFYIMYFLPKYTQMIQNIKLTVLVRTSRRKKKKREKKEEGKTETNTETERRGRRGERGREKRLRG